MCGRARATARPSEIRNIVNRVLNAQLPENDAIVNNAIVNNAENLTPGMTMYVAYINENNELAVDPMIWGIKMNKMTLFNTRSEELMNKPMFNKLMKNNRGVVVLDGFYEFASNGKGRPKTKYMITPLKEQYFIVPVLFNNKGCFTMLTQPPVTEIFKTIHERQPVILSNSQLYCWIYINEKEMQYENIRDVDKSLNTFKLTARLDNLVAA